MTQLEGKETELPKVFPSDFYYEPEQLVRPLQKWEISRDHLIFSDICGFDTSKRQVLQYLEDPKIGEHGGVILMTAGNVIQVLTLTEIDDGISSPILDRKYLFGYSGGGIGSIALHPNKKFFAVGEKGVKPNIYIYRYPELQVCRVLKNGTEFAYSSVQFSSDGKALASVGGNPDYLLTIWDWQNEQTILRCKAFGQEVFHVQFAPNDNGFLTTSGVGHVRFWKMASTFTGLKLQGDIGKFGKSELSDIESFCVLPDKKVLSGTERGVLLLWDGNFIKCEIYTETRNLPHEGAIQVVLYEPNDQQIVTAGKDGWIKWWDFDVIDHADVPQDDTVASLPTKREIFLGENIDIRAIVRAKDHYLVQDMAGAIHQVFMSTEDIRFNYLYSETGKITGIATSPFEHLAASCGKDGTVALWDYPRSTCLFKTSIQSSGASAITWVPSLSTSSSSSFSRQVAVGFEDGLLRIFCADLNQNKWIRTKVFKPHHKKIIRIDFAPNKQIIATSSEDGSFFLFQRKKKKMN
jgi:WD40 repeat protein